MTHPEALAAPVATAGMSEITRRLVLHWGEMGSRWGVNRTVAQIHALLYVSGRPMHAEELVHELGVARSNVSNSLRELQGWKLVRTVHLMGDRREYFECQGDVWELFRTIVSERRAREFDPTLAVLEELMGDPAMAREATIVRQRVGAMLSFMHTLSHWTEEMLRLEPTMLMRLLKTGARIQRFLRGSKEGGDGHGD
jgi:DNA-binding transcriptional regulator GbsR (MarR family)